MTRMTSSIPKRRQQDMMGDSSQSFSCSENSVGEEGESSQSQSQSSSSAKHRKRFGSRSSSCGGLLPQETAAAPQYDDFLLHQEEIQHNPYSSSFQYQTHNAAQHHYHSQYQHQHQHQQEEENVVVPCLIKTRSDGDTPLSFILQQHQQQYQRTTCGGGGIGCTDYTHLASSYPSHSHCNHKLTSSSSRRQYYYQHQLHSQPHVHSHNHHNHNEIVKFKIPESLFAHNKLPQATLQHQPQERRSCPTVFVSSSSTDGDGGGTGTGQKRNAMATSSCSSSSSSTNNGSGGGSSSISRSTSFLSAATDVLQLQQQQLQLQRQQQQQPHHQASLPLQVSSNNINHTNHSISMKRVIVDTIREKFRPMLEGTRLIPKMDGIQLLRPDDVLPTNNLLGTGAFSQVTSVVLKDNTYNTSTTTEKKNKKKCYACKQLKKELFTDPPSFFKAATELAYEAHILSSFDHPNIIKLRGWAADGINSFANAAYDNDDATISMGGNQGYGMSGTSAGARGENGIATATTTTTPTSFFLIMDVLRETLDQRIDRWKTIDRPQSLSQFHQRNIEKLSLCKQLAGTLEYIHSKGVVYRDLKPQNVGFCTEGGSLKLFDFGLCRELPVPSSESESASAHNNSNNNNNVDPNERFQLSGMVGTMRYMAPEVCLNQPYNRDCDIYSWSIVSWEILSQAKPFETFTPDLYAKLVCMQGVRPTDLPMIAPISASSSRRPRRNAMDSYGENVNTNIVDNVGTVTAVPQELKLLLKQAWRGEPTQRIRLSQVQSQLALFRQLEELRLEEQELQDNSSSSSFGVNYGEGEEEEDDGGGDDLTPVTNTNTTDNNSSSSSTLTTTSTAVTSTEEDAHSFNIPSPRTNRNIRAGIIGGTGFMTSMGMTTSGASTSSSSTKIVISTTGLVFDGVPGTSLISPDSYGMISQSSSSSSAATATATTTTKQLHQVQQQQQQQA
jgi:serine/threonine protein kinase